MGLIGEMSVVFDADTTKLKKGTKEAEKTVSNFSQNMMRLGGVMAAAFSVDAIVSFTRSTIKAASDFAETESKFKTVFKGIENEATSMAENLQKNYLLSKNEAFSLLAATGDLMTGFGMQKDEALKLSNSIQELAADLASFNNLEGGTKQASEILTKALLGERDALTTLGIKISEEDVKLRLLTKGQKDLTGQALLAARAQATFELATEQSGNALGDMARTSKGYANQVRALQANVESLQIEMGQKLLPIALSVVESFNELLTTETGVSRATDKIADSFGGLIDSTDALFASLGGVNEQGQNAIGIWDVFGAVIDGLSAPFRALAEYNTVFIEKLTQTVEWIRKASNELQTFFGITEEHAGSEGEKAGFAYFTQFAAGYKNFSDVIDAATKKAMEASKAPKPEQAKAGKPKQDKKESEKIEVDEKKKILDEIAALQRSQTEQEIYETQEKYNTLIEAAKKYGEDFTALEIQRDEKIKEIEAKAAEESLKLRNETQAQIAELQRNEFDQERFLIEEKYRILKENAVKTGLATAETYKVMADAMKKELDGVTKKEQEALTSSMKFMQMWLDFQEKSVSVIANVVEEFTSLMLEEEGTWREKMKSFGNFMKKLTKQLIAQFLAQTIASAIAKAMAGVPFPANLAAAASSAATSAGIFAAAVPAFADGGIVSQPTLAYIGEYPGARQNPEAVGKLSEFQKMIDFNTGSADMVSEQKKTNNLLANYRYVVGDKIYDLRGNVTVLK